MIAPLVLGPRMVRSGLRVAETMGQLLLLRSPPRLEQRARLMSQMAARVLQDHCIRVQLQGELPRRPSILVCNHVSYLDPLAILAHAPALPLAKAEIARWPVVGRLAQSLGARFVQREDAHSGAGAIRWMVRTLRQGASVLAFPEGTTTTGAGVNPFLPGAFAAARHAGVAVIPFAISYATPELAWVGDDRFLPHYLRTASRAAVDIKLGIGELIRPNRYCTDWEMARRARAAIASQLLETTPWASSERSTISRAA